MNNSSVTEPKTISIELLNKSAPLKNEYLRANYSTFMTKEPSKAMMLKTKLQNQFLKKRTSEAKLNITSKETYVSACLEKLKRIITKTLT